MEMDCNLLNNVLGYNCRHVLRFSPKWMGRKVKLYHSKKAGFLQELDVVRRSPEPPTRFRFFSLLRTP